MNKAGNFLLNLSLISTTLRRIANPGQLLLDCLGMSRRPYPLRLRSGPSIWVRPGTTDKGIVKEVFLLGHYASALENLGETGTVVDVGAQIGTFTTYVAHARPGVRLHSFEPMSENFELLQRNQETNHLSNVTAHRKAVAGKTGSVRLYLSADNTGMHSLYRPSERFEEVEALGINELHARLNADYFDVIKLDCEGAEHEIIENATPETLRRVGAFVMEYHDPARVHELKERLEKEGFAVTIANHDSLLYAVRPKNVSR